MVVNIEFKNESTQEKPKRGKPNPVLHDSQIKAAFDKLQEKKDKHQLTVAEYRRYQRIKRQGDQALNKASITGNKPSKPIDLTTINQNDTTPTQYKVQSVIDKVYNGANVIEACNQSNISPRKFYEFLEDSQNFELKRQFFSARCLLAEFYLARREQLENDLKNGRIDPSTYSCLSADYKYLAGKLAPLAYGDKIQLDATVERIDSAPSQTKLEQLNKLLQITDAEFTVE